MTAVDNTEFVQRIDRLLAKRKLSWKRFDTIISRRLGGPANLAGLRDNSVSPTQPVLRAIADYLHVPASRLVKDTDNSTLVRRMDDLRRKRGLTWIELNRLVGERLQWSLSTTNYINRIRHNKVSPSLRVISAIADSLGVPTSELLEEGE